MQASSMEHHHGTLETCKHQTDSALQVTHRCLRCSRRRPQMLQEDMQACNNPWRQAYLQMPLSSTKSQSSSALHCL